MNPYQVVRDFEQELCRYTGAKYAVTTNSCTMALLLAVAWHLKFRTREDREGMLSWHGRPPIEIPRRTYVSVAMSILHAGGRPTFRDEVWRGAYQLKPLPVWDAARWFTSGIFVRLQEQDARRTADADSLRRQMVCVSFHATKTLSDTQGGAILHDDHEADQWLRRARFDGRSELHAPSEDRFEQPGWHCYMSNDVAARLLHRMRALARHNEPMANDLYPDLSDAMQFPIFR